MINSKNLKKLDEFVEKSNKLAVVAHADPDGDSIGSIMALREILKTKGKDVDFFINGEIPFNYKFIKDLDKASLFYKEKKYDLFFALDSSDEERLADKVDISEEVARLKYHTDSVNKLSTASATESLDTIPYNLIGLSLSS